jgi:phage FluMu protein gp41
LSLAAAARGKIPGSQADLDRAWDVLAQPNAATAYDALIVFASNPDGAMELLRKRLRAAPPLDAAILDRIVADLESEKFATRERAANDLEKLCRTAVAAIRARAAKVESLETKRRLAQFLERHESGPIVTDELRAVRALEFLENVVTPAASALIADLTTGEPAAERTIAAIATKDRLDRRKK